MRVDSVDRGCMRVYTKTAHRERAVRLTWLTRAMLTSWGNRLLTVGAGVNRGGDSVNRGAVIRSDGRGDSL